MSWHCVKSNLLKCPGILQSELDYSEPHVITKHPITCTKNSGKINVTKCVNEMLQVAKHNEKKPEQIFSEVVAKVDRNTKALMPAEEIVKRRLRRQKSKNNPINPNCLNQLVIENDWCYLGNKSTRFLLHDNGIEETEPIIVFATNNCLRYLTETSTWYIDGNFSMTLLIFQQLYMIRVNINSVFITAAFILLKNKTETSYQEMLQIIILKCAERNLFPDPQIINVDFEKAVINAIKTVIGEDVNHKHPTIWTLVTKMRHENAADETKVTQRQLGTIGPPLKNKRYDILKHLCEECSDGNRDIPIFLNAIANFIRN
ncbi:hypothetical protein QTP88_009141 [Uroleucon formosanum]